MRIAMRFNSDVSQSNSSRTSSGHRDSQQTYQSGFAVICSQALNSLCSRRLCSRLARNRLISVASSPLAPRRTCAPGSIVLLADSAIGLGQLAVTATPSRTRRPRTSPAALPAFRRLRSALFALLLMSSLAGVAAPRPSLGLERD